jgi:hypothetical protein
LQYRNPWVVVSEGFPDDALFVIDVHEMCSDVRHCFLESISLFCQVLHYIVVRQPKTVEVLPERLLWYHVWMLGYANGRSRYSWKRKGIVRA